MNPYLRSIEDFCGWATVVRLDEIAVADVAQKLAREELPVPAWRIQNVLPERDNETFIQYVGLVTSVNFAFTNFEPPHRKFEIEWKGQNYSGSVALGACFMRALEEGIPALDARYLRSLTSEQAKRIFRGIQPIPLLDERLKILRQTGEVLIERYDGRFANLFKEADFMAFSRSVVEIGIIKRLITEFSGYRDSAYHSRSGQLLRFNKKAQLCVLIYQGRALSSGGKLKLIEDADDIGPVADYAVPAALTSMGILKYEKSLEEKIKRREIIRAGSDEELEIRAQTVLAMEKLRKEINKRKAEKINMAHLDYKIWSFGRLSQEPHHLTPTICY